MEAVVNLLPHCRLFREIFYISESGGDCRRQFAFDYLLKFVFRIPKLLRSNANVYRKGVAVSYAE